VLTHTGPISSEDIRAAGIDLIARAAKEGFTRVLVGVNRGMPLKAFVDKSLALEWLHGP